LLPTFFNKRAKSFTDSYNFYLRYYSLSKVKDLYQKQIDISIRNSGIPLVKPVANNFTHLSALNRFILPFYDKEKDILTKDDFVEYFDLDDSKASSHFKVHKQMCEYFELIEDISETKQFSKVKLTEYGKRFRDNLNNEFAIKKGLSKSGVKRIELSIEQKRILIESLMNGNIGERKGKVNILYFLRFVHLTEGIWVPRGRDLEKKYVDFANNFLGTDYTQGVISNWLNFICTHCEELGLVERIKTNSANDRAVLTSFGSRVLGFIEMDLHLKREKIQIPLQI